MQVGAVSNIRWALSQNCEKRLLASSCLPVRHSAWNISVPTKTYFHEIWYCFIFFENLSRHFNFDWNLKKSLFLNINQFDPLNFIISLFQASTCFEHMCVEAWNKLIIKFSASSWLILINKYIEMDGQQCIKNKTQCFGNRIFLSSGKQ